MPTSSESLPDLSAETVLLSLGSDIEPGKNLPQAYRLLASRLRIVETSRVFETAPVGVGDRSAFLNAALEAHCDLTPRELKFEVLRPVERQLGRVRTADRNAPRTIDLDISLVGQRVFQDRVAGIEIPDPEILRQAHVAIPLAEVAPERLHPVTGQRLREIADLLDDRGIRALAEVDSWPQRGDSR